ncbi:hypothetical protein CPB97_004672 [Podila verticillata]|nr:hypothetical protein CPB97_004672 [Podila verticillata]
MTAASSNNTHNNSHLQSLNRLERKQGTSSGSSSNQEEQVKAFIQEDSFYNEEDEGYEEGDADDETKEFKNPAMAGASSSSRSVIDLIEPSSAGAMSGECVMGPPTAANGGKGRGKGKGPYLGFKRDLKLLIILLQALDVVKPFSTGYGKTKQAWEGVIAFLHQHDEGLVAAGGKPVFEGVTVHCCQDNWDDLVSEFKQYQAKLDTGTGINPKVTELIKHTQPVYLYAQSIKEKSASRADKQKAVQERVEANKKKSQDLLASSQRGPRWAHDDNDQQVVDLSHVHLLDATLQDQDMMPPHSNQQDMTPPNATGQPSAGILSGAESESGASSVTSVMP